MMERVKDKEESSKVERKRTRETKEQERGESKRREIKDLVSRTRKNERKKE